MSQALTIAIDAMGGDHAPSVPVGATLALLRRQPQLQAILVGPPDQLEPLLASCPARLRERLAVAAASQVVGMDEPPAEALRRKRDSSMRVAINMVQAGRAQACVSAGNTGALMATAKFVLKMLPGVDRPAIVSAIPALGGHTLMLDLGANTVCTARQLCEFAVMGDIVASDLHGVGSPRIGLLNIGTEDIKGNSTLKQAHQWLRASELNYQGFIEGTDIMSGRMDVVVTDGFTGNVALKTIEGTARMLARVTREEIKRSLLRRTMALGAAPLFRSLAARIDPRRYNGASFVGLQGIVIKSHGGADETAFATALETAVLEVRKGVPTRIGQVMAQQSFDEETG
ncbi:phosphate acyltransferase PlsX [Thioalkalivibrio sp. XN8]|uniref:phosphate acyltransferase PlsX n=1 Tax=Thioalkalivibrio sp. XN8 TaxID=2712863 RepID=UPI0013ED8D21|nr:phosphate acyltransferase PlsX [Thioalkalivibrio sp. XN8]NGP53852.1 phosphate acyltransferase PlsX [Thioalkalivibrio sp. XN8]